MPPVRKRFGQHFLHDPGILGRIADAVGATDADTVIEIGPGRGALTDHLRQRAGRIIAIELDRDLAALLRARSAADARVTILEQDVLDVDLGALAGGDFLLAGNVPYHITTPLVFLALRPPRPRRAVYLVQREVAERLVSPPGTKAYGALTVNAQALARIELLFHVPAGAFTPPPKVDSAVVRFTPREMPDVPPGLEARFRSFVIAVFGARRKQMRRVLRTVLPASADEAERLLAAAEIDPAARPETLAPADFARLVSLLGETEQPRLA